jgi:hypothetical protein
VQRPLSGGESATTTVYGRKRAPAKNRHPLIDCTQKAINFRH